MGKTKPTIAVNARLLLKDKLEGLGTFKHEILQRLCSNHPEVDFLLLFDRPFHSNFIYEANCKGVHIPPPTRHPLLWDIWLKYSVPFYLRKKKVDAFLSLDGFALPKSNLPQVITVHDINFHHRPQDLPNHIARYYQKRFPQFIDAASKVLTVSEFSKTDLMSAYHVEEEKLAVAYNALPGFDLPDDVSASKERLKQMTNGAPFFIYVGALHERKNVKRLVLAFKEFQKTTDGDYHLIIAGAPHSHFQTEWQEFLQNEGNEHIHSPGRINDVDKFTWLKESQALIYPSLFEGFGIPILEAWRSETAVITSNCTALPEVAGDAALLVEPESVDSLKQAMSQITQSESLRHELIEKGSKRLRSFSWDKSAEIVWNSIQACLS